MVRKVLVVDDSPSVRQQVRVALANTGVEVVEAEDGLEALEKWQGCALVVCDVNMPRMNGIEFLEHGGGASVPVIMLTTEGRAELVARARKAGAKGWLVKPFNPDQLANVVRKLLG